MNLCPNDNVVWDDWLCLKFWRSREIFVERHVEKGIIWPFELRTLKVQILIPK